jgi:hypothetical protein
MHDACCRQYTWVYSALPLPPGFVDICTSQSYDLTWSVPELGLASINVCDGRHQGGHANDNYSWPSRRLTRASGVQCKMKDDVAVCKINPS